MRSTATACCSFLAVLCATSLEAVAAPPAFPGAEGFGAVASGGRGGDVYYVTNLDDDGPGSLRDAIRRGNRNVLFQVSGTIDLKSPLRVDADNLTIAGQTAPGDGICLRGKELSISGNNVIVRFLRLRPGDELGQEHDALTIRNAHRVIVDHCSLSWSTDSLNDVVRDTSDVTVQWCILAEPLNDSVHAKGAHGYGTGWGSGPAGGNSFHHNLLAHCNSRSPRIGSEPGALVDVRNNVIYNLGGGWAYGGERARVNYVANFYKPGPNTRRPHQLFRISSPDTRMFLRDNFVVGDPRVSHDNALGLDADQGVDAAQAMAAEPFPVAPVDTDSPQDSYELVLQFAGAIAPQRDAADARIVSDVRNGTGRIIDSPREVGGWPKLGSAQPPADADADGLPDDWERQRGLHHRDPTDAPRLASDGYSHLEHYLNGLVAASMPSRTAEATGPQDSPLEP